MAKATWNTVDPSSSSGNGAINIGATVYTGRLQRTSTPTVKATGAPDEVINATQKAKPEFVTINNVSAPKAGGNVTITGKSNSSKLTFSLGAGDIVVTLPGTYSAGGATTNNAALITGDPGASAEFDFSITLNVPANNTTSAKTRVVSVLATGGQSTSATITQSAGDPILTVTPKTITIEADGTPVTVTVTSNTNWTVE